MTREQAEAPAERLGREHPDRRTHAWFARQDATGEWALVKVGRPAGRPGPVHPSTEARPKPRIQRTPQVLPHWLAP